MSSKFTRRNLLRYAGLVTSAAVVAACQPQVVKETVVVTQKEIVKETVVVKQVQETTKVIFWPRGASDEETFTRMLPIAREMFPEIDVVFQTPAERIYEKLRVSLAGGTAPDATVMNTPSGVPMIGEGIFLPLTPFLNKDTAVKDALDNNFAQAAVTAYSFQDELFCIPITSESQVVWYNKDAMEEAGLTPPAEIEDDPDKWNWDTLIEYAQKLNKGEGRDRERFGIVSWGIQSGYGNYLYAMGGRFFTDDGKKTAINSPEGAQALQFVKDMIFKWDVSPGADTMTDGTMTRTMFQIGGTGIITQGEYFRRYLWGSRAPSEGIEMNYDLARWPFAPSGKRTVVYHCLGAPIIKGTKIPDETWKWLQVIASQRAQQIVTDHWGSRGADERTYQPWLDGNAGGGPEGLNYSAITRGDEDAFPYPVTPYMSYGPVGEVEGRYVRDQILRDSISIEEGLAAMEQELNAAIATSMRELGVS